jgi:hypothetical protein
MVLITNLTPPKGNEISNISNSSVSTITASNSNNKITQKIENNVNEGAKVYNNYNTQILPKSSESSPKTLKPNKTAPQQIQSVLQQFQSSTKQPSILEDSTIGEYLTLIKKHRNDGADLAKCNLVQLCLEEYNNWQNEANNLLTQVDNYIKNTCHKRSELQQKFSSKTLDGRYFPDTKDSLESLQSLFFSRVETFGLVTYNLN